MATYLQQQLKERMDAKNLSIYALEKKSGLNRSAVRNILQGFSKKPSVDILKAVALVLECSVDDLIGTDSNEGTVSKIVTKSKTKEQTMWNEELYISSIMLISNLLEEKGLNLTLEQILPLVNETYKYSISKNSNVVDKDFTTWLVNRSF